MKDDLVRYTLSQFRMIGTAASLCFLHLLNIQALKYEQNFHTYLRVKIHKANNAGSASHKRRK